MKKLIKKTVKKPVKEDEVTGLKRQMTRLKRESNAKIKALESKVEEITKGLRKKEADLQASKNLIAQKEAEVNRLSEELKYKDQQLVSKTLAMEDYEKSTQNRILELEAKVKELEAKAGEISSTP